MKTITLIISFIISGMNVTLCQHIDIPSSKFSQEIRDKNLLEKNRIKSSGIEQCISVENKSTKEIITAQKDYDKSGFLNRTIVWINDSITHKADYKFDSLGNKLAETIYYSNDSIRKRSYTEYDSLGNPITIFNYRDWDSTEHVKKMKYNSKGKIVEKSRFYSYNNSNTKEQFFYKDDTLLIKYYKREKKPPKSKGPRRVTRGQNISDSLHTTDNGIKEIIHVLSYEENKLITETIRNKYYKTSTKISYKLENNSWLIIDTTFSIDTGGLKRIIHYEYNEKGFLISEIDSTADRAGTDDWRVNEIIYKYNDLNQIIEKFEYHTSSNYKQLKHSEISEYDDNGNKISLIRQRGKSWGDSTYYKYDDNNNLIEEKNYSHNKFHDCEIKYFYGREGELLIKERLFPFDSERNQYGSSLKYNRENFTDSSFLKREIIIYYDFGRIKERIQFNNFGNFQKKIVRDEYGRIKHSIVFKDNGEVLYNMVYKYDQNGNPLEQSHYDQYGNLEWSKIFNYTYYHD